MPKSWFWAGNKKADKNPDLYRVTQKFTVPIFLIRDNVRPTDLYHLIFVQYKYFLTVKMKYISMALYIHFIKHMIH